MILLMIGINLEIKKNKVVAIEWCKEKNIEFEYEF